jgi:hypothetical protein
MNKSYILLMTMFFVSLKGALAQQNITQENQLIPDRTAPFYSGAVYFNTYRIKNNLHPFLGAYDDQSGGVWYQGVYHAYDYLKYDIFQGQLIAKSSSANELVYIALDMSLVDKFHIGDKWMVKKKNPTANQFGFLELLWSGESVHLWKSEQRKRIKKREGVLDYLEFKPVISYYIEIKQVLYLLDRNLKLSALFPKSDEVLNKIQDELDRQKKEQSEESLINIVSSLDKISAL